MVKASYLTNTVAISALWDVTQLKVSWPCSCFAQEQMHLSFLWWWPKLSEDTGLCKILKPKDWCNAGTCTRDTGVCHHQLYKFPTFFQSCLCPMLWAGSVLTVSASTVHTEHTALAGREGTSLLHGSAQRGGRSPIKSQISSCHCHNTNTT